jgi:hypothetical protein
VPALDGWLPDKQIGIAQGKLYAHRMKRIAGGLLAILALISMTSNLIAETNTNDLAGNTTGSQTREGIQTLHIRINPEFVLGRISPDFIGLGYETSAVAQTNYFSAENTTLIQLYRNLSSEGLIRIGGNISDHTRYVPDAPSQVKAEREVTVINQANLRNLAGFVRATGWKVMWGLNLGTGSKAEAVQEAVAVDTALRANLQSFQIGNEVEVLPRFGHTYENYHAAYTDYKQAVRAALPEAPFSGPDSVGNWNWITNFAGTESGDMKLLTHHYYRGGANDPTTSIAKLLSPDDGWIRRLARLQKLSRVYAVPFRINEVNSFSGGGKPGVSDTFASAIWCLDYMFRVATYGGDGVNMETDINQLGWISHYSPIIHDASGNCRVGPEYYGMLAFAQAGKGELLQVAMDETVANVSVYATRNVDGQTWIIIINKDLSRDIGAQIALPKGDSGAMAFWLTAPSADSKDHVTLAGAEVSANGTWSGEKPEPMDSQNGILNLSVPRVSAVLLRL